MFFQKSANIDGVLKTIKPKIEALLNACKHGIDIEVKQSTKERTSPQNRFLWAVYKNIVEFHYQTGFIPDNQPLKFIHSDFLHHYFKARFDIKSTAKLSTTEFMEYADKIQLLMTEQSGGSYDSIYPDDSNYFQQM